VSRRAVGIAGAGAAVALAAALGFVVFRGDGSATAASTEPSTGTASIERRDLVLREDVDGTLGYADPRPLQAGSGGTVTRLPAEGAVIRRGESLYAVDGRGVRLLYGATPLWRRLGLGVDDGPDVLQLERNLDALGYDPASMTVDDHFDADTASAVRDWQKGIGVPETGAVAPGEAVFLPGARRVGTISASVGAALQPSQEVMQTTSTAPVVSIDLDATKRTIARTGARVTVELPSGHTVRGRIASVGKVAESQTDQQGVQSTPTVPVVVTLLQPSGEDLDGAPVSVSIEEDRESNVLAVPVEALLALSGGGSGVELVATDGTRTLIGVDTGTFADGWVEITGRGVRRGAKVVVPE
jgi:peptidoglycan hydrolase-like protein with peptidoglycan-binding domain